MKKEFISVGKTINEAIENAFDQLKIDRDNAEIEILETPSKGFLGLGGSIAKVKIVYNVAEENDVKDFVETLFHKMGINSAKATIINNENELHINVEGKEIGSIIGRRGETLDALQYILNLFINRNNEVYIRVILDIENYRQKRQETLERLAKRLAASAVKNKGSVYLEPMQAYERRIIHSVLQDFKDVSTSSTGIEPRRKVVISYTPDKQD